MTSGQRTAHRLIWILLVIVLSVFMFFSLKEMDLKTPKKNSLNIEETSLRTPLNIAENNLVKVNIYADELEIILKSPLKNASSTVYAIDKNGTHINRLGQITTSGIYSFPIKEKLDGILLFDVIKQTEITKLLF